MEVQIVSSSQDMFLCLVWRAAYLCYLTAATLVQMCDVFSALSLSVLKVSNIAHVLSHQSSGTRTPLHPFPCLLPQGAFNLYYGQNREIRIQFSLSCLESLYLLMTKSSWVCSIVVFFFCWEARHEWLEPGCPALHVQHYGAFVSVFFENNVLAPLYSWQSVLSRK